MGNSSLVYVLGLSMLVSYALLNMNSSGTDSVKNFSVYYGRTVAHDIAVSGANIGCSHAFWDSTYATPYRNIAFLGGTMNVRFTTAGNRKYVTSVGKIVIGPITFCDTVVAQLRNQTLARYSWFTNFEANKVGMGTSWSTGDTAWGPAHTNDKFNINGSPVYMKKATAWQSAVPKINSAVWAGGYEWGFKIPYPTSLADFISAATDPVNGRCIVGNDAYLEFEPAGSIHLRVPDTGYDTTFANATDFTHNGAFAVLKADLYVEGTLTGDIAVGAVAAGAGAVGNVFITGDVRYKTDPRVNPSSTDKLGIYAENDVTVTYDPGSPGLYQNRNVDASVFSLKSEFNVQDHNTYPPRGRLTTFGAMMQYYRGGIGIVNPGSGTLLHGYYKNFRYDERLATGPPKYFPAMGRYSLYAWREN